MIEQNFGFDNRELKWHKLIFRNNISNKFWRIACNDNNVLINYGKKKTIGKYYEKKFTYKTEALQYIEKQMLKKMNKGYIKKKIKFLNDNCNTVLEYEKYNDVMSENYKDLENNPKKLKSLWDCSDLMREYDIWNKEEMQEFLETKLNTIKMKKKNKTKLKKDINKCIKNIE